MAGNEYLNYILEMLEPMKATSRGMFGGFGIYHNGVIMAILVEDQLYAKVGDSNKNDYIEAGCFPFQYESKGKKISIGYWSLPPDVIDDQDALCSWMEKAYKVSMKMQITKIKKAK